MLEPEFMDLDFGRIAIFSNRSPDKEGENEDAAAIIIEGSVAVLVVADGAGGMRAGAKASAIAVETLIEFVSNSSKQNQTVRDIILNGIEAASQRIAALGMGSGTTIAVAEINDQTIRPYHVGDSDILVCGQRGKMKLQTLSHSPVAYAVEAGLIDEQDALHHDERHLVSNLLGFSEMRIEIGPPVSLAARDTLLLASDGIFDNLYIDEIVEMIRIGSMEDAVHLLMKACQARMIAPQAGQPGKPDDLTFILYRSSR